MRISYLALAYRRRLDLNNRIKIVLKHWIDLRDKLYLKLIKLDKEPLVYNDKLILEHKRQISSDIRNCTYHINILKKDIRETDQILNRLPLG